MRESWEHSIFHLLFTFSIRCRSQWSSHPIWWWRVHGNSWPSSYSPSSSIALLSTDKFHLSYWGWRLHLLKNIRHKIRTHHRIPPKVIPLKPASFIGRLLTTTQAELVLVRSSVEDKKFCPSHPPVTRNTWKHYQQAGLSWTQHKVESVEFRTSTPLFI